MTQPVFISYARQSGTDASLLARELGADTAFLDISDLGAGDRFPSTLATALFDARVVVVFADERYFQRSYCWREFMVALAPYDAAVRNRNASEEDLEAAVSHIVLSVPDERYWIIEENLPPILRQQNRAAGVSALAALVCTRLQANPTPIGARIPDQDRERLRQSLESRLPPPLPLNKSLCYLPGVAPSLGDRFVGREDDLYRLYAKLHVGRQALHSAALTGAVEGVGGVGKTTLVTEFVHRYGPAYYQGGIFWINAAIEVRPQWHAILRLLRPETRQLKDYSDEDDLGAELAAVIGDVPPSSPVLVVVDNIPETEERGIADYWPALGRATVLATSRARLSIENAVEAFPISELRAEDAVRLLASEVSSGLAHSEWVEVVQWVGCLPLALEILNAALRAGAVSPPTLLARSRDCAPTEVVDQIKHKRRGVREALEISYSLLSGEGKLGASLLAQLAPEPIPEVIVEAMRLSADVRRTLRVRSFVQPASDSFGVMHRLVADFLRTREREDTARLAETNPGMEFEFSRTKQLAVKMISMIVGPEDIGYDYRAFRPLLPHFEFLLREVPQDPSGFGEYRWLFLLLIRFYREAGLYRKADEAQKKLLDSSARAEGVNSSWVRQLSDAFDNSPQRLKERMEIDASAAEGSVRVFGGETPVSIGLRQAAIAQALKLGIPDKALGLSAEGVAVASRLFGPKSSEALMAKILFGEAVGLNGDRTGFRHASDEILALCSDDTIVDRLAPHHSLENTAPGRLELLRGVTLLGVRAFTRGWFEIARPILETALSLSRRLQFSRETDATAAAYHLYLLLRTAKKQSAAETLYTTELAWLTDADSLSDTQEQIRNRLETSRTRHEKTPSWISRLRSRIFHNG